MDSRLAASRSRILQHLSFGSSWHGRAEALTVFIFSLYVMVRASLSLLFFEVLFWFASLAPPHTLNPDTSEAGIPRYRHSNPSRRMAELITRAVANLEYPPPPTDLLYLPLPGYATHRAAPTPSPTPSPSAAV